MSVMVVALCGGGLNRRLQAHSAARQGVLEQAHLATDQGAKIIVYKRQDRIGHRL